MPNDGESVKLKKRADTKKGIDYDYARKVSTNPDKSGHTGNNNRDSGAFFTHETGMGLVWKRALELNKLEGQQRQGVDERQPSDQPPSVQKIASDFQYVIAANLGIIEGVLEKAKRDGFVTERDVMKMHSRIFGSSGTSGACLPYIRDNIPLSPFVQRKITASLLLWEPIKKFQKALMDFKEVLDQAFSWKYEELGQIFSWKYENTVGLHLGCGHLPKVDPSTEALLVAPDNQERLEGKYEAVREMGEALNKCLGYIIALGASQENWEYVSRKGEEARRKRIRSKL